MGVPKAPEAMQAFRKTEEFLSFSMDQPAGNRPFNWSRLEAILLLLLVGLALWPIWANAFFLTNDGPCHLYNARVLRDLLLGQDTAFYREWYYLNPAIEPNWLNHFLLMVFQLVLPPVFSEKLFLSIYIVGYVLSFRYLARSIFPANGALVFLVMPFIFHKVFLLGFFNFSASVVVFFLVVGYWLRHRKNNSLRSRLVLGLLMLLLILTHPVSYCMAMGLIALHWLGETVAVAIKKGNLRGQFLIMLTTAVAALPSIALLVAFVVRQGTKSTPSTAKFHDLFHKFLELKSLVLFQPFEKPLPIILSILIGLLGVMACFRLMKRPTVHEGILVMLALSIYAYFTQPAEVGGVGIIPDRLQFFPYLIMLCWLATIPWPRWVLRGAAIYGFLLTATLFAMRFPSMARTSDAVEEFVSVREHMQPHTTVALLNYAPEGRAPFDGPVLSKEAYVFMHVAEYLGALQPHIMLNNYEAHTKWFPLRWEENRDPFIHLGNIEGWLPMANVERFRNETGHEVDYILTWCLTEELRQFDDVKRMLARLDKDFTEVFVTKGQRVRVFERKTLMKPD